MLTSVENKLSSRFDSVVSTASIIAPVKDADLRDLQTLLDKYPSTDPYQRSAGYFAMTGRDGLWKVQRNESAVLLCRHPNNPETVLVFPPIGKEGRALLGTTLKTLSKADVNIQMARLTEDIPLFIPQTNGSAPRMSVTPMTETVLDWAYPVHTLDTNLVVARRGRKFQTFRTDVNGIDQSKVKAIWLDPTKHREALKQVVQEWAGRHQEKATSYMRLLDMFENAPLSGRLLFHDDKPVGFSIWEETNPKKGIANAFAHLALHDQRGMSQYVMLDMCQSLKERGYTRVCIGGSETEGLDRFKRKMYPVQSVPLHSYAVTPQVLQPDFVNGANGQHKRFG